MNSGDQLTERVKKQTQSQVVIEEEEYTYSDNGHLTSRVLTVGGNDYTTSYQYDVGGNLKQVTLPDSSTVTYQYDAYGNRVKKQTASEKVSYEYAGGSCQREIHRNLSDTILYTLRYFPWGFSKTVPGTPDVTTAYYYLVDTRGWVWGLTDSDGVIVETYQYSPYGELLSTPTITHSRFLSGADECLWDSETGLYYLQARYYDPQLGRFIQEDIVEGDLESPASQNRYTYCQNDPVSLIDPSGYSPENTNTLNRYNQINIANLDSPYGCSLSDLQPVLPALTPSDGGEWFGPEDRNQMIGSSDGCGGEQLQGQGGWKDYITSRISLVDSNGNEIGTFYTLKINGKKIYVYAPKNGEPQATGNDLDPGSKAIVDGLNAGFADITRRGGDWSKINVRVLLNDIANFTNDNLSAWLSIFIDRTGNPAKDAVFTFIKHATVGGAIKQAIAYDQRVGDQSPGGNGDHGQFNMMFGFWASYFCTEAEKMGKPMFKWDTDMSKSDPVLGIVDIARVGRSQMYSEHQSGAFIPDDDPSPNYNDDGSIDSYDWGLMQVNDKNFKNLKYKGIFSNLQGFWNNELWKSNPFANIGAGMGEQFYLFTAPEYSPINKNGNRLSTWLKIGLAYNNGCVDNDGVVRWHDYYESYDYYIRFKKHLLKNLGR